MSFTDILCDTADGIMTITLNRPDKLNAFSRTMRDELIAAFGQADADDDVRVVIVTGAGRGYCAGADLERGEETFNFEKRAELRPDGLNRDGGGRLTLRVFQCRKPVICAVNGPAVGIGVTMTLPMDIRLASSKARFGFVFARCGIVPEACSSYFLPRIVGISRALEWSLSGRVFDAAEALQHGLVSEVLDPAELLARQIADNTSAVSVAMTRQMMWRMLGADHPMDAHKIDSRAMLQLGKAADAREGVQSFLEKRPADFTMKVRSDMPEVYPWWHEPEFE